MRVKIVPRAVLLVAAVVLLAFATGCSGEVAQANASIDAANEHLEAYARAGTELESLMSRAESLPMEPAGARQGIELTDQMKAKLDERKAAATAAREQLGRIREMDVREEFKAYADKQIAVTATLLQQDVPARAIVDDLGKVYGIVASGKGTQKDVEVIGERIDAAGKQLTELEAQGERQQKEASAYFDAKQLGGGR